MAPSSSPAASPPRGSFLPALLFGYTLVLQVGLLVGSRVYFGAGSGDLSAAALAPKGWDDPLTMAVYGLGLAVFVAGYGVPAAMARRALGLPGSGSGHPLSRAITPYIVRLCLFETCSLAGFVLAFTSGAFTPMVPLAALGLIGTMGSPPTTGFLDRMGGMGGMM